MEQGQPPTEDDDRVESAGVDGALSEDADRWRRRSGWIAEETESGPPPVDAPATRPIRTRSRIVAAAVGDEPERLDLRETKPDEAIDLREAVQPPAVPAAAVPSTDVGVPGVAVASAAQENDAVKRVEPGGGGTDAPSSPRAPAPQTSTKWGAERSSTTVPQPRRSAPRLTVTDPDNKYGPSLVSLSDPTDPGMSVPSAGGSEPAEPAPASAAAERPLRAAAMPPATYPAETPTRSVAPVERPDDDRPRNSRVFTSGLFIVALCLAVVAGILGALWQRERGTTADLEAQLAAAQTVEEADDGAAVAALEDEIRTLEIQNEQLARDKAELESLVAPVPEGRITEIPVPFQPFAVDEIRGRIIAIDPAGEFVLWSDGADAGITDSGMIGGIPLSLFAHRDNAWVATDAGTIEVKSLVDGSDVLEVAGADATLIAPSSRTVWSYVPGTGELRRHRESNGNVTATVTVPAEIRELSVGAGSVWALGDDGLVYRVNTADLTVAPIAAGQEVVSISAGTDALWALSAADGSLRRVDAVTGDVLVTVPVGRDPIDVEFSGSSVWVLLRSGETLIEVDTRTSAVVSRTSLPAVPLAVTSGSTGVLVTLGGDVPLVRVSSSIESAEDADAALNAEAEETADGEAAADG